VGAILGVQGQGLTEIVSLSGAKIVISKRFATYHNYVKQCNTLLL
jgi:hypothetical protein